MKLQKLLSYVRRAVDDYSMIEEGDKIAVGISGGKDSICLLVALKHLQRFYPKRFELRQLPSPSVCQVQAMTAYRHSAMSWVCIIPLWKPISAKSFLMSEKKKIPALSVQKCGRAH